MIFKIPIPGWQRLKMINWEEWWNSDNLLQDIILAFVHRNWVKPLERPWSLGQDSNPGSLEYGMGVLIINHYAWHSQNIQTHKERYITLQPVFTCDFMSLFLIQRNIKLLFQELIQQPASRTNRTHNSTSSTTYLVIKFHMKYHLVQFRLQKIMDFTWRYCP
jgi:hypothetical protein